MRQSALWISLLGSLTVIHSAQALPSHVSALVDKACMSKDGFVQYAVVKAVQEQYPGYDAQIQSYWRQNCAPAEQVMPVVDVPSIMPKKPVKPALSGSLEAAADVQTGNTERSNFLLSGKLRYDVEKWRTTAEALARNDVEDSTTTAEEYRALLRSDYKLDPVNFLFAEAEYVKDRFSGYDYRLSETLGYGRIFYDEEDFYWEGRIGGGFRQDRLTNGDNENSMLAKLATDLDWTFAEGWSLSEAGEVSIAEEVTIFESETALKSQIIDALALKAAFYVEHITDVPPDTHDTDTRTTLGVVYDF